MKNILVTFIVFFILTSVPILSIECSSNDSTNINKEIKTRKLQKMAEESPDINTISPENSLKSDSCRKIQPLEPWDLLLVFDVEEASGANGNMGAECTEYGKIWSTRWQSNLQHQYDHQGNLIKEFTVSGVSNIYDLAYDNSEELMAGGAAGGTIWGWDPIGETLEYTITGGFQARALAYNEDEDVFYVSNWTDPVWVVDREDTVVDQFDLEVTTSTSGFAYDRWTPEPAPEGSSGPYLWIFDQTSGDPDLIYQYDLCLGEFVGEAHDVGIDLGTSSGIAGGLFFTIEYECGYGVIGGLLQGTPDMMFVYECCIISCICPDIGIRNIVSPEDGDAGEDMDVIVQVKNYGNNTETDVLVSVVISKDGIYEEYNETEYINKIDPGETVDLEMPTWTPNDWQSTNNEYKNYKIIANAWVWGDTDPSNDNKEKWFELYFGYFHDVGCTDVISPISGPAKTYPVISKIKNFGQYKECCFKTYVEIAEIDYSNPVTTWSEDFELGSGNTPPPGWDIGDSNSNAWDWDYYSNYLPFPYSSGKSTRLYWYYASGAELISPEIDTSNAEFIELTMGSYIEHYTGKFELLVEIRANPDDFWTDITPWENPVNKDLKPDWYTSDLNMSDGTKTQLRFSLGGNYWNLNYWYFDNIMLKAYNLLEPEFEDVKCVPDIEPGDELEINFNKWTPEFLSKKTTDTKKYIIKAWTDLKDPPDENLTNDEYTKSVTLEFFHDVSVKEIIFPPEGCKREVAFSQPPYLPTENWAFYLSSSESGYLCQEDFWGLFHNIGIVEWWGLTLVYPWAACDPTVMEFEVIFYEGGPTPGPMVETFSDMLPTYVGTGLFYSGFEMYKWRLGFCGLIDLETGWISIQNTYSPFGCWFLWAGSPVGNCNALQNGGELNDNLSLNLTVVYDPRLYVPIGPQSITASVENIGTFPEIDLTCYAEIYEYITNCTNGTLVYEDNITDIDLEEPLGGTYKCIFEDYNFTKEGLYRLFIKLPLEVDDYPKNNLAKLRIKVDGTPPVTNHSIVPEEPNGENGWYISNVNVTLEAADPSIGCGYPGSGVLYIKYRIGNGSWETILGKKGTFTITSADDADNLTIEYYSIDKIGNEESHHTFTIDMDQTKPDMEQVQWEAVKISGSWYVEFTCNATDITSGMNRVVMYKNQGVHEVNTTPAGSIYNFLIQWLTDFEKVTFKFEHYDNAGNMVFDEINGDTIKSASAKAKQYTQTITTTQNIIKNSR